jgi:Tol biopolymer transport system component
MPVLQGVASNPSSAAVHLAWAADGSAVYLPGAAATGANPIDWVARDGKTSPLRAAKTEWGDIRFSPDGQKLAVDIGDGKQRDVWVYEWSRDTLTQLTFDPNDDFSPVWTPDSRRIVFASDRAKKGVTNLYWVNADGTGDVKRLTDSPVSQYPASWHPSGKYLAFHQNTATTSWDLMILAMEGDAQKGWTPGKSTTFVATPAIEIFPMFSPDGRWIAYFSNEHAGTFEVYVRPFPGPGGVWKVSPEGGGGFPSWSRTANELLFVFQNKIWFAPYTVVGDSFRADKPQPWSPTGIRGLGTQNPYDIHPDGKRLAAIAVVDQTSANADKVVFVFNFLDYLKATVPAGKK